MAKSNYMSNALLALVFNATTFPNVANNASTSPLTNLFIALHTADPTSAGAQSNNEATYTAYSRVTVARTSGGWTVTANAVSPVAAITFPAATGGSSAVTFFSVGVAASGATNMLYSGSVSPSITVTNGVTPQLTTATVISES